MKPVTTCLIICEFNKVSVQNKIFEINNVSILIKFEFSIEMTYIFVI